MQVIDIGLALLQQAKKGPKTGLIPLGPAPSVWTLVCVAPGATLVIPAIPHEARGVLVLEGKATYEVDDTRQTLASGHLLQTPINTAVTVINDGSGPLSALSHIIAVHAPPAIQP